MLDRLTGRLTYANVTATLALVVALGGTSYAALRVGSAQIVNDSVRSVDIRNNSVRGRDVRFRSLTGRDIVYGSLGGDEIEEGELGTVGNANRLQGRVLGELIVGCSGTLLRTAAACLEDSSRPPAGWVAADAQCNDVYGRLPSLVELLNSGALYTTAEWTSDILSESDGALTTVIYGPDGISSAPVSAGPRPYRCVLPLSN